MASIVDEVKRKVKTQGFSTESKVQQTSQKSSGYKGSAEYQQIKNRIKSAGISFDDIGVNQDYINSFVKDANTFFNTAQKDYESVGWGNATSVYDSKSKTYSDLYDRWRNINSWVNVNKNNIDESTYNNLTKVLANFSKNAPSVVKSFEDSKKFYSQFDTEDAYNRWNANRIAKEEQEQEIMSAEDFGEYSQIGANIKNPTYREAEGWMTFGDWRLGGEDIGNIVTFSRDNIADIYDAYEDVHSNLAAANILGDQRYQYMTDNEVAIYNYYLGKGEKDKAAEYLSSLEEDLNARYSGEIVGNVQGSKFLELTLGGLAGIDSGVSGLMALDNYIKGTEADPVTALQYASGQVRENIDGGWGVAYDLLNTTGNMLPSILVGMVNPNLGAATLGASAMGNAYSEMRRLGYSDGQAKNYGFLVGASEAVLSKFLGGISKLGGGGKGIFQTVASKIVPKLDNAIGRVAIQVVGNMLDEGLEEAIQEVLDPVFKAAITGEDFEGIDLEQVLYSGLLGVLSAGFLEGAPSIAGTAISSHNANKVYGANVGELVTESLEIDPTNKHAARMKERLDNGKGVSGYQINRLVETNESTMLEQDRSAIQKAAAERLTALGETGDVAALSKALAKQAAGEKLSLSEKSLIKNSKYGQRVANELNPESISSGEYSTAWSEQIGTNRINYDEYNKGITEETATTAENPSSAVAKAVDTTENSPATEIASEGKIEASENAKGETTKAEIAGVEVDGDQASFTLSNGEKVGLDSVAFKSENEKLVAQIAVERVSRGTSFSNEAATAFIKGYDGSISPSQYTMAFDDAFKMGASGAPSSKLIGVINSGVSEKMAYTAYVLGKQSAENVGSVLKSESENGIINTNKSEAENESGEDVHLRNGGKRVRGKNTQRQVSRMEGSSGQAESRGKTARVADSEAARLVNEGREVKVADLGILGGSNEQTVRLVDKADETSSMKKARERAEERGLKVTFFVGDNLVIKDKGGEWISARAYIKGKHVFVRADHSLYTADQLMRHELGHDMIAKGEVDINAVRERIEQSVGKEYIDEVAKLYADAYADTGMSAEEIWEECICDSLGDMNIFAGKETIGTFMGAMLPEISAAASESKSPTQTRGSPEGKASRESRRQKYISYSSLGMPVVNHIRGELKKIYSEVDSGVADEIAIEKGNKVYIVHSGKENGEINFGVTKIISISDEQGRKEFIRRTNNEAVSEDRVSDGLSSKLKSEDANNRGSNLRRELGTELQADTRESENQQVGVSQTNADKRGVSEKYSSPEEAKESGKVSDAKFSIEFADDIANKQRKFVADGLSRISSEELEKAIADTAHMVNEMKPYANILPQDKVGKTLVKNGSYDVSVENTTVCIRTLAYNSFVDMVSEKVGRPLTQMESFLVSQKLYEIAKEPQCLYCYVSLDRKAFNEMVIRYTEQRDAAISAYEDAGKPEIPSKFDAEWSLFKDFLDGRKPTKNMWDRYVGWISSYNKGERMVSLSDISTEAKRLELVESGGEIASQVKDILKYAQSASWAKKQTQYVAYYDEILKLKPAVIRNLNNHYGMRWYSFSDYSGAFIVENMQQITDAAIRGLKGLSYTKDTDFAEIFAPTGMNINISVFAKKTEGGYEIDAKQSANIEEAIKLREQYPNVGIVVVATDKEGVEWALAQEWSDVVIPFHTVRTGADVAEFYNWEVFNSEQNDAVTDQNLWDAYVNEVGKKKVSKMVYPSEHQNNRDTYLSICEKRGLSPRFKSFLDNPNYMKLVNETRQSESQTSPLKAVYNLEAAERSFDKFVEKGGYYEGWYNDGIDVDGEAEIVADDVLAGKKANEVGYGRQDISFDDVAKSRKNNRQHGKASRELDFIDFINENTDVDERKPLSNREILATALESVAQSDIERDKLKEYKGKIALIESEQAKLSDLRGKIKDLSFAKGSRDTAAIKKLQFEANQTANRINTYDRQLLNLESTKALKGVLEREKQMAYKRAEKRGKEALAKYKEKATETQRELMTRYQEARKKGVESRNKTEMRHKIKDVVHRLDKLLNHGTKERNVKTEMSEFVRTVLEMTDMLFATDDELITSGIKSTARENEKRAIERFNALYEEYHSYDDSVTENKEKRAELRKEMNEIKKVLSELLDTERARINNAKASNIFDNLIKEIENISTSQNEYIRNAFDEDKIEFIKDLKSKVGNTLVKDMTLTQLEVVYKALRVVETTVAKSNKLFGHKDDQTVDMWGASAVREIKAHGEKKLISEVGKDVSNLIGWNNLKPIYLAERLGSATLQRLMNDVLKAESEWAKYVAEAEKFVAEAKKKHGYKKWDFQKKWEFNTGTGLTYELDLGLMMTLYAYAQRGETAMNHLRNDGFAFDKLKVKKSIITYELNDTTAYKVTDEAMLKIGKILTDEQKLFVSEMQKYLSDVLGARGNIVSEQLVGIPLFNETNYLPIRAEGAYLERKRLKDEGNIKIKNRGMTKPTNENARNTIILSDFLTLCTEHMVEMNEYAAFTLPLENFYKVYNWQNKSSEDTNKVGVIPALDNAYGKGTAVKAIDQLLKDLNGGARGDYREGIANKAIASFKKAKVMFSASVIIQQPSSILRAQAMISPKYFVGIKDTYNKSNHRSQWEELKKYAPVAVIKEMGYFDVGMGQSTAKWIAGDKTWRDVLDDFTSKGAALADEITWIAIWKAVKRETIHKNPSMNPKSEEFLELAGERFEDIIRHTQVYDSTLARSANMRSKNAYMKMLTSFLAEPTTSINMREMALRSKDKTRIARTTAAVYASSLLNAILVALPYAARDDDDDETYLEKYFSALASSFANNINPINSLPFLKDIWSLAVGYDVERSDMSVASDLIDDLTGMVKSAVNQDMDELTSYVIDMVGDLSNFTGIPVKNAVREVTAVINWVKTITKDAGERDNSWLSFADELVETLKNEVPVWGWLPDKNKSDKLYDAIIKGDTAYVDRLKSGYKSDSSFNSAIRKALRENDPRIKEAAEAVIEGDFGVYDRLRNEIVGEGNFSEKNIKAAIASEVEKMKPDETEDDTSEDSEGKVESAYKMEWLYSEITMGDIAMAKSMREEMINTHMANGKTRTAAEASFNSSFSSYLNEQYAKGTLSDSEAKKMLVNYGGKSEDEAASKVRHWAFKLENPKYSDFSESAVNKYYDGYYKDGKLYGKSAQSYGISLDVYAEYIRGISGLDNKKDIMYVINTLPLTKTQKDALYYLNGWEKSTLHEAPWR